jgi:hypothetical protein
MNTGMSLSIFTIVVDQKPVVAFGCKKHSEASNLRGRTDPSEA